MRNYMMENFVNKNVEVMLVDGNTEKGVLKDFDGKYIYFNTGKSVLFPPKMLIIPIHLTNW